MCKLVNPDICAWWNNNKNTINLWIKSFWRNCESSVTEYELIILTPQLWRSHSASSPCIQSEVKVTAQNLSPVSGSLSCQRVTSSAASAMTNVGGTNCPAGLGLETDGCVTARALSQELLDPSFILFGALFVHQVAFLVEPVTFSDSMLSSHSGSKKITAMGLYTHYQTAFFTLLSVSLDRTGPDWANKS